VRPAAPGWRRALVRPVQGPLARASGTVPTPRGPIRVAWSGREGFTMTLALPPGIAARIEIPAPAGSRGVFRDGAPVRARREGPRWVLDDEIEGSVTLVVR